MEEHFGDIHNSSLTGYNISNTEAVWQLTDTQERPVIPETANSAMTTTFKIKVTFGVIGMVIVIVSILVYMITCYKSAPNKKKCLALEEKRVQIKLLPLSDPGELKKEPIRHKTARMQRINSVRRSVSAGSDESTSCGYLCSTSGTSSTLMSNCVDELDEVLNASEEVMVQVEQQPQQHQITTGVTFLASPETELPSENVKDSIGLFLKT